MRTPLSRWQNALAVFALAALCALLAGCGGGADLYVLADDAKSVEPGSPVRWRGVEVGRVSEVTPAAEKFKITVELSDEYRSVIRSGVSAKPENGILTAFTPTLRLYGGADEAFPKLRRGSKVPLAGTVVPGVSTANLVTPPVIVLGALAAVALLLFLAFKGVKKLLAFVFTLAFLAVGIWIFREQWHKHKDAVVTPELESKWDAFANKTFRSPDAALIWEAVRDDTAALVDKASKQGGEAVDQARTAALEELDARIAKLKEEGKDGLAAELAALKEKIESSKDDPEE